MSGLTNEQLNELVEYLQGTCHDLYVGLGAIGVSNYELTMDDSYYIDERIFNCEMCGWWCEVGKMGEDVFGRRACTDCAEDEEEEDE